MKRWYAVHCKPAQDERAEYHLSRQSYEVFRPRHRVRRRRQGRMVTLIESLFPRYLFIHLDDVNENWAPIRSTRGVAGLVRLGRLVPTVPDWVVDPLRDAADEEGCVAAPAADYQAGDRLLIEQGALAGHEALFYARRAEDRIMVLLEIMNQQQKVELPESALRPL